MAKPTIATASTGGSNAQPRAMRRRPLSARKLDLLYLVFFAIHVPVMLLVDLAAFYPASLTPRLSTTLRTYYITTYADRFFVAPPLWFTAYLVLEAVYHLPVSVWFIWAIPRDHPLVPLHLLLFALETALTTLTCIVDTAEWPSYSAEQRSAVYALYLPYLALAVIMGADAFLRVKRRILQGQGAERKEKSG